MFLLNTKDRPSKVRIIEEHPDQKRRDFLVNSLKTVSTLAIGSVLGHFSTNIRNKVENILEDKNPISEKPKEEQKEPKEVVESIEQNDNLWTTCKLVDNIEPMSLKHRNLTDINKHIRDPEYIYDNFLKHLNAFQSKENMIEIIRLCIEKASQITDDKGTPLIYTDMFLPTVFSIMRTETGFRDITNQYGSCKGLMQVHVQNKWLFDKDCPPHSKTINKKPIGYECGITNGFNYLKKAKFPSTGDSLLDMIKEGRTDLVLGAYNTGSSYFTPEIKDMPFYKDGKNIQLYGYNFQRLKKRKNTKFKTVVEKVRQKLSKGAWKWVLKKKKVDASTTYYTGGNYAENIRYLLSNQAFMASMQTGDASLANNIYSGKVYRNIDNLRKLMISLGAGLAGNTRKFCIAPNKKGYKSIPVSPIDIRQKLSKKQKVYLKSLLEAPGVKQYLKAVVGYANTDIDFFMSKELMSAMSKVYDVPLERGKKTMLSER